MVKSRTITLKFIRVIMKVYRLHQIMSYNACDINQSGSKNDLDISSEVLIPLHQLESIRRELVICYVMMG